MIELDPDERRQLAQRHLNDQMRAARAQVRRRDRLDLILFFGGLVLMVVLVLSAPTFMQSSAGSWVALVVSLIALFGGARLSSRSVRDWLQGLSHRREAQRRGRS